MSNVLHGNYLVDQFQAGICSRHHATAQRHRHRICIDGVIAHLGWQIGESPPLTSFTNGQRCETMRPNCPRVMHRYDTET